MSGPDTTAAIGGPSRSEQFKLAAFQALQSGKTHLKGAGNAALGFAGSTKDRLASAKEPTREFIGNRAKAFFSNNTGFVLGATGAALMFTRKTVERTPLEKWLVPAMVLFLPVKLGVEYSYKFVRMAWQKWDNRNERVVFRGAHLRDLVNNEENQNEFLKAIKLAGAGSYSFKLDEKNAEIVRVYKGEQWIDSIKTNNAQTYVNASNVNKLDEKRQEAEKHIKTLSSSTDQDAIQNEVRAINALGFNVRFHTGTSGKYEMTLIYDNKDLQKYEISEEASQHGRNAQNWFFQSNRSMEESVIL